MTREHEQTGHAPGFYGEEDAAQELRSGRSSINIHPRMSQVALIIASVLVFAFVGWAYVDEFRSQPTGAKRLAFVTASAGGCAVGAQGAGESAVAHWIAWSVVAALGALTSYAKWRERERERLTRGNSI